MQKLLQQFTDFRLTQSNWTNNYDLPSREVFVFKYRRWLVDFQKSMKSLPQTEIKVYHKFIGDYYIRTAIIPKDTFLIGATHTMPMVDTVLYGDITIMIDGQHVRMKPGDRFASLAGSKKAGATHEDTAYSNIYLTKERDIKQIEADTLLTEEEEESYINTELKYLGVV